MTLQIKRTYIDFVARDYAANRPKVQIISQDPKKDQSISENSEPPVIGPIPWTKKFVRASVDLFPSIYKFVARLFILPPESPFRLCCYLSLQGEDHPAVSSMLPASPEAVASGADKHIYRYDWAFGITLLEGFYWDWQRELGDDGALAIHLILQHEPFKDGPDAIPIAAFLSTLHPSRDTKSIWEQALPMIPKAAADMAKFGATTLPALNYLSSALMLGSNVLASRTEKQTNWFLYQFFDEKLQCPVVEWRISKKVLIEYGPLIRGTVFLSFQSPPTGTGHKVKIQLRPQLRYCKSDDICYIIPTNYAGKDSQVFIDVHPT